jgi:outer membrane protein OmpA-like peptidoglycan-associated protein
MAKATRLSIFVALAGLNLVLAGGAASADTLSHAQIINTLGQVAADARAVDPTLLGQEVEANLGKGAADLPSWRQLEGLAQMNVEIDFEYNASAIEPESYRTIGLIAEALHHPILQGHKFLIVGHTDSTGDPKYNLKLSQKRADSIKRALVAVFALPEQHLFTVGVGAELPVDSTDPKAAKNRRVQLINIGLAK